MRSPVKGLLMLSLASAAMVLGGCDAKPEEPTASDTAVVDKDKDLEDLLKSQGQVSIFAELLDDAELDEVFDGPAPYTIIAPVNAAFEAVPKEDLKQLTEGEERAAKASSYALMHILPGYVSIADIKAALESSDGEPVKMKTMANPFIQANNQIRSKKNVAHHYDLGNDFYRLFLDEDMQYSCAYFTDREMTLETAQVAKKAHIAAKLALEPGQRVLDIGCGWGGMALYLNRVADVKVHGITLSEEQFALAKQRAVEAGVDKDVTFELVDYRDLAEREDQGFDRIVSVGMFEHVGQPNFETFFRACRKLLKPDGAMLIHTIGRFSGPGATSSFTQKHIFPGGYIPALSETVAASEKAKLMASDVETLRMHYGWTLRHWYDRTLAQRDQIIAMYDERFFRMWTFYLAGAASAFEWGGMGNYQIQYLRSRRAVPVTRDYIAEREAEYIAKG